ncbi:pyridoxamine 5'-phosphate oxidase family protein [Arthrobacter sp. Y-9]|uniref:pyridoxamine 5'-phosphate oxidase family protein n=1 Tax=Arthrobacter sp. Y-9 TaxID=3039385 RepID=UPI00241F79F4|nr:pyridoxamine 5'-phosphate oxidase family protein [Arthrobacter sp. Y-9]WFR84816.1 pyridoxamine 5'-phosphate oxidase family protein [Arthrobacter sp. Y-9]
MARRYEQLTDQLTDFIREQQMFFVATAARDGRVNVSPKGLDSLRVLSPDRVVWLNGTGSGNETAAHLRDTPRMTLMFCAFTAKPSILRLYGSARAVHRGDPEWDGLVALFPPLRGARNVFDLKIEMVQTSCGFGVPLYEFQEQRPLMDSWAERKGEDGLVAYQQEHNRFSIDGFSTGLPEVERTRDA